MAQRVRKPSEYDFSKFIFKVKPTRNGKLIIMTFNYNNHESGVFRPNDVIFRVRGKIPFNISPSLKEQHRINGIKPHDLPFDERQRLKYRVVYNVSDEFPDTLEAFDFQTVIIHSSKMKTIPLALTVLTGQFGANFGMVMAGAVIATLPMLVVYLLFQKYIIRGIEMTGLKG